MYEISSCIIYFLPLSCLFMFIACALHGELLHDQMEWDCACAARGVRETGVVNFLFLDVPEALVGYACDWTLTRALRLRADQ